MKHVCFENQNDIIKKLLKACPVLEDLHTLYPRYVRREEKKKSKPLILSKLVRADIGSIDVPFTAIQNVEFLCLRRVQEPSLEMKVEEIFKNITTFQNLIHVELVFHGWDGVVDLLRHCPRLQVILIKKVCSFFFLDSFACYFI